MILWFLYGINTNQEDMKQKIITDICRKCNHSIRLTWYDGWKHQNLLHRMRCWNPRPRLIKSSEENKEGNLTI